MNHHDGVRLEQPLPPMHVVQQEFHAPSFQNITHDAVTDNLLSYNPPRTSSHISNNSFRKPIDMERKLHGGQENYPPNSPGHYRVRRPSASLGEATIATEESLTPSEEGHSRTASRDVETPEPDRNSTASPPLPPTQTIPIRQRHIRDPSASIPHSQAAEISTTNTLSIHEEDAKLSRCSNGEDEQDEPTEVYPPLQYSHQPYNDSPRMHNKTNRPVSPVPDLQLPPTNNQRPNSAFTAGSGSDGSHGRNQRQSYLSVGRTPSPGGSPIPRPHSSNRFSPDNRPTSYIDLLNIPYTQQVAPAPNLDNSILRGAVGSNAALLETSKTLEMYRANVKKTSDSAVQYEFAIFMVQTAMDLPVDGGKGPNPRDEMLKEARQILHKLADRSYPFAQYYLADGFASGLFNKGKEDHDRAFPLFLAASKHGHAESGYRTGLSYEFGWGCRRDHLKAVQFYRASASKNHPGSATRLGMACLKGTMGLTHHYREGIKWLKRAAESADAQYNAAPYELGRLHENGYGEDIFKDEVYAAQLFTQSADLGHPEANLVMGKAYEHGLLSCPKDAALSIHFYNGAAQAGLPEAMMALCAWYLFGAEPILIKDENEAFEWAKRAAELDFAKAEYAVGYFKEVGIGCRLDTLEANVWYVRAAQHGEERAKQRLNVIQDAASGGSSGGTTLSERPKNKKGLFGKFGTKDSGSS
ncbi:HCP-like protein [Venturia nashicola]|uniref:HCP-like protein n=1 Tax=Venturia nashicola TaxID=86259 RepID=A0A4Z1NQ30_9PEZI|nr:HCP-like protein [Venturia nashicola]